VTRSETAGAERRFGPPRVRQAGGRQISDTLQEKENPYEESKNMLSAVAVLMGLLCLAVYFSGLFQKYRLAVAIVAIAVSAVLLLVCRAVEMKWAAERQRVMDDVFAENISIAARLINQVSIPCLLVEAGGRVVWRNESLRKLFEELDIKIVQPHFDITAPWWRRRWSMPATPIR
jgi:c-di-AMP phosphodiesterase-like protein